MTTQTYRRARHSVSLLHAHLVFVTKYRRPVFTDAMLTCKPCAACATTWAPGSSSSTTKPTTCTCWSPTRPHWQSRSWSSDSRAAPLTPCAAVHRRLCPRPHARPPLVAVLLRRLLRRRTTVDHPAIHRRPSPPTLNARLRPPTHGMGSPRTEVRGLRPRCPVSRLTAAEADRRSHDSRSARGARARPSLPTSCSPGGCAAG